VENRTVFHIGLEKRDDWGKESRIPQALPQESWTKNTCEREGIGHFTPLLPHFHRYYYYYVFIS
jgi:hypothetical protein